MSAPSELITSRDSTMLHEDTANNSMVPEDPKTEAEMCLPKDCFLLPKQNDGLQIPYYLSSEREVDKIRPPPVVKTWSERFAEFSPEEQKVFTEFRETVIAAPWYDASMIDDWALLRYLKARDFTAAKSLKMLENTIKWRKESGCDSWKCDICLKDPNQHCGQFMGWDLEHRPVLAMSMRWGPERTNPLRHMVCGFNHLVRLMPLGVEQWVFVTDFETYSHFRDSKPSMGMSVIRTIQDHFPERLGKVLCLNPPTMFWVLWKMFYPVIDPVTRTKVEFLYTEDKPSAYESFPKLFPPHLSHYLYDFYNRSKKNLPAVPLVWRPQAGGYPDNWEERKEEMKNGKLEAKRQKHADAEKKSQASTKASASKTSATKAPAAASPPPPSSSSQARAAPASGAGAGKAESQSASLSEKEQKREEKEAKKADKAKREAEKQAEKDAKKEQKKADKETKKEKS